MADTTNARGTSDLHVALVGAGRQGLALLEALTNPAAPVPGARVVAVCDIWDFARDRAVARLRDAGQTARGYTEWTDLLARERDLDAVFIATPDRTHAAIALAALDAGLHVYVEPMLAQTLDDARRVIRTARERGRCVQVGYDGRSHPYYGRCRDEIWRRRDIMGPARLAEAVHQECDRESRYVRRALQVGADRLRRHGYSSMHELLNWSRFRRHAGHLLPRRAPRQLDSLVWFAGGRPFAVLASGGREACLDRDVFDQTFALLSFRGPDGVLRASYRGCSFAAGEGPYERFAGTNGHFTLEPDCSIVAVKPEGGRGYASWTNPPFASVLMGNRLGDVDLLLEALGRDPVQVCPTCNPILAYQLPVSTAGRTSVQHHVENFLAAIRGEAALNAPAETAFVTEVVVRRIAEAIAAKREIELAATDFEVAAPAPPAVPPPVPAKPAPRAEWVA